MKRRPVLLLSSTLTILICGTFALWLRVQRRQYALNRQLIAALVHNDTKQALTLVNAGADPNTRYNPPAAPTVKLLIERLLHPQSPPVDESPTAFLLACGAGWEVMEETYDETYHRPENVQLVQAMLTHHAYLHAHTFYKHTTLTGAVELNRKRTVELLLKQGLNINEQDAYGMTPLMGAVITDCRDVVPLLLERGANANAQNYEGTPVLYYAMRYGKNTDVVRQLLTYGAHVNAKDVAGETPLMWAVSSNQSAMVRLLLDKGANVNSQDDKGRTPLYLAVRDERDLDIVRSLLAHGADPTLPDKAGRTALDIIRKEKRTDLQSLLQHGKKITAQNRSPHR